MTTFTRTNAGDPQELETAKAVAEAIAAHYATYEPDGRDFFLADHTHECLSPGTATVAWEGGPYEWPIWWPETAAAAKLARRLRVRFEAVNGVILAVYPNETAGR
jgi:hypothetical protein